MWMLCLRSAPILFLTGASAAVTAGSDPSRTFDINRLPPQPQATICGEIVHEYLYQDEPFLSANQAIQCLTSVPFDPAVAVRIVDSVNRTFQYHATTAFIRDPPAGYQQPPFDFFGTLAAIFSKVMSNYYHNQYAFELELQTAIKNLHDNHAYLAGGIIDQFYFLSPFRFVSLSKDGKQAPDIYIYDDVIGEVEGRLPSADFITKINGLNAVDYLSAFAAEQSFGMLEPNADWNQLFESPAQQLFGLNLLYEYAPFYAGDEINITYHNGTSYSDEWSAFYQPDVFTGPLTTGGDFFNFFVLGLSPANLDEELAAYLVDHKPDLTTLLVGLDEDGPETTSWHKNSSAYPDNPIMIQRDLGLLTSGSLTGYHLPRAKAAVLSVPTFEFSGFGIDTFLEAVEDFVANATQRDASTIIIDLQQNSGGLAVLAYVLYLKFFPRDVPFAGSRMRSHPEANILGAALTNRYQSLLSKVSADEVDDDGIDDYILSEWVAIDRINAATSHNFSSWPEYYGPIQINGDTFSLTQRYNWLDPIFTHLVSAYANSVINVNESGEARWSATNIVILTDGVCGSTCSLFVEMMHEQGVRSVVVGGLPEAGPMQAACGSRGAAAYNDEYLYNDYDHAREVNATAGGLLPQWSSDSVFQGITVGFTLRDQIRPNATVPNQVLYLPAYCRLYWTFSNIYNLTQLWTDVYNAMYVDQSKCVPGSVNAIAPSTNHTVTALNHSESISQSNSQSISHNIIKGLVNSEDDSDFIDLLGGSALGNVEDDGFPPAGGGSARLYSACTRASNHLDCYSMKFECQSPATDAKKVYSKVCVDNGGRHNCGRGSCNTNAFLVSKGNNRAAGRMISTGACQPPWKAAAQMSCSTLNNNPKALADALNGNWDV